MRLRRLDLLRYGHLSDVTLSFPDDVALHVVYGVNEAGKSTALAAIADGLFGFGHRTDFDFLHGARNLRVGFTVAGRDGAAGSFVRTKGRRDTLRDAADRPVPEDALGRFLGGVGRDRFERDFGLDGARLREGGRELLRVGGEVGESLLAGVGLLNLRKVLAKLDEDARALVGDGRGRRRLSEAVDAWRRAQRESEERAVAPRAWHDAETAQAAAVAELAEVQSEIRVLAGENSRLQRVRRIAPLLRQLDDARAKLRLLADAPRLPADAAERFQALQATRRDAGRDRARETGDVQRLTQERAALSQDDAVLAQQEAIDTLVARRELVLQAVRDLPPVEAHAAGLRAQVSEAARMLGLALEPDAARDAVPSAAVQRTVQRLIREHGRLSAGIDAAERAIADGQRARDRAAQALAASSPPASPALLRRTIEAARGEGPLERDLDHAAGVLADAEARVVSALAALPLWRGDLASLVACPLPLPAETDGVAATLQSAREQLAATRDAADRLAADIAALQSEVARFAGGDTVPTRDAVAAARAARDRIWRAIRRAGEGDGAGPADPGDGTPLPAGHLPELFETLRDQADRLADRRADEAQRVADFLSATERLERARERGTAATEGLARAETRAAGAEAMWRALWAPAGVEPLAPPAMREWRQARDEVLRRAEQAAVLRRQRDDLAARRARARQALAERLADGPPGEMLAALLLRAETACAADEGRLAEHTRLEDELGRAEAQLPELRTSRADAAAAMEGWRQNWSKALVPLGLPDDAGVDVAEAALESWARISEAGPLWRADEHRINAMRTSIDAYAADVRAVVARLRDAVTEEPGPVIAARLGRRLVDARKAVSEADDLATRIAAHQRAAAAAARTLAEIDDELATLRGLAGAADDEALQQAIERARQRDATAAGIAQIERSLAAEGDGIAENVLRAEMDRTDLDALVGRLAEIENQQATLGERREALSAQRTRAETVLADLRHGHDAAAAAQQAEDALALARDTAERYARLHVARVLLRSGIDRFRRAQQGPLLHAAGGYLALLTAGRYARLAVEYDAADRPVLVAIRDNETECPVEALSEGTRDQLYLALRVAAVQTYAAQAEPLPFIADDLLVHFDDTRAAAAIALLAELGTSTQVILFTHHDHIVALAERQAGVAVQRLPAVATPALAGPAIPGAVAVL